MSASPPLDDPRIERLRRFNRFYTRRIGVLDEGLLHTRFSLAEARLLWELAHAPPEAPLTARALAARLDLDPGYLSRLLGGFKQRRLVKATAAPHDARQQLLALTAAGRRAFAPLDRRSREQAGAQLARLDDARQRDLLQALATVERLLDDAPAPADAPWLLRAHRPGDIGWLISRHGALYAREYGWDITFEALVARIAADFVDRLDPAREACWIAERDGANLGGVCLVQAREAAGDAPVPGVAQLRLLLVEPTARGLGIGQRLVGECTRFARQAGYRRVRLWTQSILTAARAIYRREGYVLVDSEPHRSFGQDLVGERWELALD